MSAFALIVGLILLAVAVALLVKGLVAPQEQGPEVVDQIGAYGFTSTAAAGADEIGGEHRRVGDFAISLGNMVEKVLGTMKESEIRSRLIAAGWYSTTPRAFVGYQLMLSIGITFLWIWLGGLAGVSALVYVVGILLSALFGWYVPSIILTRRMQERHHQIDRALPELIDLLVVTVEAGVGFVGSLRMAAQQLDGPLAQELRLTIQEQTMGLSSTEAIEVKLKRVDTPGIRSFVRAIAQGETLGVSIGQILRNLTDEMRKKRKARAEELAQKAPVKMLFPLIFLIFPAMFVVLLLPAIIQIARTLGN